MRLRRFGVSAAAVAALGLLGTACEPPMELTVGVSKTATLHEPTNEVTVRGTISCNRPEPVDVEIVLVQSGFRQQSGLTGIDGCDGPDPHPWSAKFLMDERFVYGSLEQLTVVAYTNPSRLIDEDRVEVTRLSDVSGWPKLVEG